ncbi:hypothetical protein [Enterobacter phage 01_vB_Eclo_IJM]|nr:hypothetical protein [Enterobacter phage 01_vB_Eclo_IJM]
MASCLVRTSSCSRSAGYFAFFLKSVATLSDDDPSTWL